MHVINLRMKQVRALKELILEDGTLNTEALMLILTSKYSKQNGDLVFKYLDAQEDEKIMGRKMYTLNLLNSSNEYKNVEELIIPDTIVIVENQIAGFAMPLIKNHTNLGNIINDDDADLSEKLKYIKKLGKILNKVQRIDNESFKMQFGDLNEFNFIIDESDRVLAIDLDSAYVGQDEPSNSAYYLLKNKYLEHMPDKYKVNSNGVFIPNEDSDLYCYNMILMNALSGERMFKQEIDVYYKYLAHLGDVGIDKELIKIFNYIYQPTHNQNPIGLIDDIDPSLKEDLSFKTFKKEYKIK